MTSDKHISKDIGEKLVKKMRKRQVREYEERLLKRESQFKNISNDLERDILNTYRKLQQLRRERDEHDLMVTEKRHQIWKICSPEVACGSPIQYHKSEWIQSVLRKNFKTKLTKDQRYWSSVFKVHCEKFQRAKIEIQKRQNFYYKRFQVENREADCFLRLKHLEKENKTVLGGG